MSTPETQAVDAAAAEAPAMPDAPKIELKMIIPLIGEIPYHTSFIRIRLHTKSPNDYLLILNS